MTLPEIAALAKMVTEEYLSDKNSAQRIGLLFTEIVKLLSNRLIGFTYLGPADITAYPPVLDPDDRVYYSMLVPKETTELPNFGISQINIATDSIFFLYWNGDGWSSNIFPLPDISKSPELLSKADKTWVEDQLENKASSEAVGQALQEFEVMLEGKADDLAVAHELEELTTLIGSKVGRYELQDVTDEQLDLLFSDGEYSINMAGGAESTYVPSEFNLKVSTDGEGNIIHTRKTSENREFSRVYTTEWGEWSQCVKNFELINVTTIDDIFDDGNYAVRMQSVPEDLTVNGFREFELKVSHYGTSRVIIQEQKAGDQTYTRSFSIELPWSPWVLVSSDLSEYATNEQLGDIEAALDAILQITSNI